MGGNFSNMVDPSSWLHINWFHPNVLNREVFESIPFGNHPVEIQLNRVHFAVHYKFASYQPPWICVWMRCYRKLDTIRGCQKALAFKKGGISWTHRIMTCGKFVFKFLPSCHLWLATMSQMPILITIPLLSSTTLRIRMNTLWMLCSCSWISWMSADFIETRTSWITH